LPTDQHSFDFVIVGAGTAGCVLANRLSADPRFRVLLIEAGGRDSYPWIHIPVGYLYCIGNPRTDWRFSADPEPRLGGRSIAFPRGRGLGGTSSINGMIYTRGQAADYDGWREDGCIGWGWDDVLPYFRRSEASHRPADRFHGRTGEMPVSPQRVAWPFYGPLIAACEEVGVRRVSDFNTGDNEGVGLYEATQRNGRRWNTARAFLAPVRSRSNLSVLLDAHVTKFSVRDGRARTVTVRCGGEERSIAIRGELVLAAGAIGTPHLLQLSGIGPAETLRDAGIEPLLDRPGIGANLQDHLQLRMVYELHNTRTLNDRARSLAGKIGIGLEYLFRRSGPLAMAPAHVGIFARSDPNQQRANLAFFIQALSLDALDKPLHPFSGITMTVCNLRPESRGMVAVRSPDPVVHPAIRPHFLSTPADERVAIDSVALTRRILAAPAMARFAVREHRPGAAVRTEDEVRAAVAQIATTNHHPVGTCRMGADPSAVVSPRLVLQGLDNVRVADASIMPRIVSGGTHAATMMIAEKASDMILTDSRA
jgi:choline dehydrogenase-like flavoprotein